VKSQPAPGGWVSTLISGTEILDSGFLSNIRVIKSFRKSVTSGLERGEGRDETGKGMDAASLPHPSASCHGPSWADWGWTPTLAGLQLRLLVHPGAMQPFLPQTPQGSQISPFWAIRSVIPRVRGWESATPTPPRLEPNRQQLQRLILPLKRLCNFNRSLFSNCKPRDVAFTFNTKEGFQGRGPTEGLRA